MSWFMIFKLGFRNILRQRLRTIFTGIALAIGVMIVIGMFSLLNGFYSQVLERNIEETTGHIQIQRASYESEQLRLPISKEYTIITNELLQEINQINTNPKNTGNSQSSNMAQILAAGGYIQFAGTMLGNGKSSPVQGTAVDHLNGPFLDMLGELIIKGSYFPPYHSTALANKAAFEQLGLAEEPVKIQVLPKDEEAAGMMLSLLPVPDAGAQQNPFKDIAGADQKPMLLLPAGVIQFIPDEILFKAKKHDLSQTFSLTLKHDSKTLSVQVHPFDLRNVEDTYVQWFMDSYRLPSKEPQEGNNPASNRILSNPLAGVILGVGLAEALHVTVGDFVKIRAKDSNGMIAADTFPVIGIFKTGIGEVNRNSFYMTLNMAQSFLQMPDRATSVKIMMDIHRSEAEHQTQLLCNLLAKEDRLIGIMEYPWQSFISGLDGLKHNLNNDNTPNKSTQEPLSTFFDALKAHVEKKTQDDPQWTPHKAYLMAIIDAMYTRSEQHPDRFKSWKDIVFEFKQAKQAIDHDALAINPWQYYSEFLIVGMRADLYSGIIMIVFIIGLVFFGILNTMAISVRQRIRELATLRAIGMQAKEVGRIIQAESMLLGIIGGVVGIIMGIGFALYMQEVGIHMPEDLTIEMPISYETVMRGQVTILDFIVGGVLALVSGFVGGFLPGRIAKKLSMTKALQGRE